MSMVPTTVPENIALAPPYVLKLIKCSCVSDTPCKLIRCGCHRARLPCTIFCCCQGEDNCFNELTRTAQYLDFDDGIDDDNNDI